MKKCIKCDTLKELDQFPKNHRCKNWRINNCKECTNTQALKYEKVKKPLSRYEKEQATLKARKTQKEMDEANMERIASPFARWRKGEIKLDLYNEKF